MKSSTAAIVIDHRKLALLPLDTRIIIRGNIYITTAYLLGLIVHDRKFQLVYTMFTPHLNCSLYTNQKVEHPNNPILFMTNINYKHLATWLWFM